MLIRRQNQGTSATNSLNLVLTMAGVVLGGTNKKGRLKKLYAHFYGGATDASGIKVAIPAADVITGASTLTMRKPVAVGPAMQAVEWDFGAEGVQLVFSSGTCTIVVSSVTNADTGSVNPTVLSGTAIWTEEN